ncbi:MAG: hypothetical protein RL459_87 [Pseudomonadota bacterium]|jgi:hypothetical protein
MSINPTSTLESIPPVKANVTQTQTHEIGFSLSRNAYSQLVLTLQDGTEHVGVQPVRAFPIAAPDEGLSLVGGDGHELVWVERLNLLPQQVLALLQEELSLREFTPTLRHIASVSTFSTPSSWAVQTDRGETTLVLDAEEDIRRLADGSLLITASNGVHYKVPPLSELDRHSRKLLERFL